jgi:3-hydroxyacyl-CoA dehydrogenase
MIVPRSKSQRGLNLMDRLLAKDVSKGKIQEADARHARERVSVIEHALGVQALRDVDMVIEVRTQTDSIVSFRPNELYHLGCFGESRDQATHI